MNFDVGSFLGGIIGGLMTLFGVVLTLKYYREQDEEKARQQRKLEKEKLLRLKPLFKVEEKEIESPDLSVALVKVEKVDVTSRVFFTYNDELLSEKLPYMEFEFTNVGRSRVRNFDIATNLKRDTALIPWDSRDVYLKHGMLSVSDCYDRTIDVGGSVTVRVYHSKFGNIVSSMGSAVLSIYFEDEHGNFWRQPFFYERCTLYDPVQMKYERYRSDLIEEDVIKCHRDPMLW